MKKDIKKLITSYLLLIGSFLTVDALAQEDKIVSFEVEKLELGFEEKPVVRLELNLLKMRDLHVAVQKVDSRKTVKRTMKRIKNSGSYHFSIDTDGIEPGKYRVNAYITPKGQNWNNRIGDTQFSVITVLDVAKAPIPSIFSTKDLIKKVTWPKQVNSNDEVILTAKFDITQERDLHLKLFNSENWEELGALKYTVKTPGDISVPFNDLVKNFDEGNYAWVVYLSDVGSEQEITKKQGKRFTISAQ